MTWSRKQNKGFPNENRKPFGGLAVCERAVPWSSARVLRDIVDSVRPSGLQRGKCGNSTKTKPDKSCSDPATVQTATPSPSRWHDIKLRSTPNMCRILLTVSSSPLKVVMFCLIALTPARVAAMARYTAKAPSSGGPAAESRP